MSSRGPRVRAPELVGRGWLNTGGSDVRLADLRGSFVLLDFWTFCCLNCLHVLDELRPVEARFAGELVVLGVHSPKFAHEADPVALRDAVERYGVHHPVLDDPTLATWQAYAVRAWPTLVLIDPEGYVVAQMSGEGHGAELADLLEQLVAEHDARGTLRRGAEVYQLPEPETTALRFPSKAVPLPSGEWLVADAGHHCLTVLAADASTVLRRIGSGERGLLDGTAEVARFAEPHGLCVLPPDVSAETPLGSSAETRTRDVSAETRPAGASAETSVVVAVADTANHAVRLVTLPDGGVRTLFRSPQAADLPGPATLMPTSAPLPLSPWDLAWDGERLVVAAAGVHQLWRLDPSTGAAEPYAGTRHEGLLDGELAQAWFAQPSGLARDGDTLWLVDAETSALRRIRNGVVHTAVGSGLFDFGHVDGPADVALMQHPLGLAILPDGSIAVADTYNGAVRRWDPASGTLSTLATGLAEPTDVIVHDDGLVVVESAAHRLSAVSLPEAALRVDTGARATQRPVTDLAAGQVRLSVVFEPPPGQHLDNRYGPSTHLVVSASPAELLAAGAGSGTALGRALILEPGEGVLHVAVRGASCDDADTEFAACHVHQQDWGVPVRVGDGPAELELILRG